MRSEPFAACMMVKQYVAVVEARTRWGSVIPFMVFRTGDDRFYLFSQLYPGTLTATGLQFPVLKSELKPHYRRALAHGWGWVASGPRPGRWWRGVRR